MSITSKQRAELRARAHHLQATIHVGHHGMTDSVRQAVDDALRTRELLKVQFSKNVDLDLRQSANDLASSVNAEVVQTIGRTATLYRKKPEPIRARGESATE